MDPSCLVSTVQAGGGGVMVWGIFSWHTLGPLVPIEHRLNTTVYLSIVADHVHPFMTTVYPSSDGYFQQDNAPWHKAQIISDWFLEHDNEFTLLKRPPQSPDLNPIEHEELRQFWRKKGVQPGTSKVYLIKWPVSVYIYIYIYIYLYVCVCVCVCVKLSKNKHIGMCSVGMFKSSKQSSFGKKKKICTALKWIVCLP